MIPDLLLSSFFIMFLRFFHIVACFPVRNFFLLLNNIPLCGYIPHNIYHHPVMDI